MSEERTLKFMEHGQYIELARELGAAYSESANDVDARLSRYREIVKSHLDVIVFGDVAEDLANQILDAEELFSEQLARSPIVDKGQEAILRAECYDQVITTWLRKKRAA